MMKLLCASLSLVLLVVASMDAAHAVPHDPAFATQAEGMPHDDHRTAEMPCCDGLSGRKAPCLGDVVVVRLDVAQVASSATPLHLKPAVAIMSVGYLPEPPTGPPKA